MRGGDTIRMHLALVIPALNEEQAIAGTLRRALAARAKVIAQTPVTRMTIVFVNDGCTDRTQTIVDQTEFAEVVKVNYGRNRGYGAAIKAGFQATDADLVGFMDADGTCDPDFCIQLVNRLEETRADVVLATRLAPDTQMPLIRKVGNRLFATLLGVMSGRMGITDTASGFRICRRSSLKWMSPLPDGLHFTPTQSAICLLDPRLKIVEVHGMLYKEREGRSKLRVVKDGLRFLWTILFSACCYAPLKTMLMGAGGVTAACLLLAPLGVFLRGSDFLSPGLALVWGLMVMVLLATGLVVHELNFLLMGPRRRVGPLERIIQGVMDHRRLILGGAAITVAGMAALAGLALAPPTTWAAHRVWLMVGLILLTVLGITAVMGGVIVRVIWAVGEKQKAISADEYQVVIKPDPLTSGRQAPLPAGKRPAPIPQPMAANH